MRQTRAPWDQVRALERNRPPSNFVLYQTYSLPESTDHLVIDLLISQGQMNMLPCQLTWSTIHHSSQYPGDAYINDPSWPVVEKLGHNFVMVVGCYSSGLYSNVNTTFSYKNIRRDACVWWWGGGLLMWYDHVTCTAAVTCTFNSFLSSVSLNINKPLNINNLTNCQH